jgi:hypothetical protein
MRTTTNYDLFTFHETNREVDLKNPLTRNLARSLENYGWFKSHPAMVVRDDGGSLVVLDGQHRIKVAEALGIPICYQEVTVPDKTQYGLDLVIKEVNNSQKSWALRDYVDSYAKGGAEPYKTLLSFHKKWSIPLGLSAALLAGTLTTGAVTRVLRTGQFRIIDLDGANAIAETCCDLAAHHKGFKKQPAITALTLCFKVDYFDPERLIAAAQSSRHLINNAADREGWLEDIEALYNYRRSQRKPLAFDANEAWRK